jgi:hypothetical protein
MRLSTLNLLTHICVAGVGVRVRGLSTTSIRVLSADATSSTLPVLKYDAVARSKRVEEYFEHDLQGGEQGQSTTLKVCVVEKREHSEFLQLLDERRSKWIDAYGLRRHVNDRLFLLPGDGDDSPQYFYTVKDLAELYCKLLCYRDQKDDAALCCSRVINAISFLE